LRAVYEEELTKLQTGRESVSERDFMKALQCTTSRLSQMHGWKHHLAHFAGPQCYPHRADEGGRMRANMPERETGGVSKPQGADVFEGFEKGWMCCDKCKKWRFVRADCLRALQESSFHERVGDPGCDVNWRQWVEKAPERYEARCKVNEKRQSGAEDGCEESAASAAEEAEEPPQSRPVGEPDAESEKSGDEPQPLAESDTNSDQSWIDALWSGLQDDPVEPGETVESDQELVEAESVTRALQSAKQALGGRGGALTAEDRKQQTAAARA